VSAPVTWGTHRLVPVVAEYRARHPGVRVELILNDRVVDLAEEGIDCAFRSGPLADDRLVARPLRSARMLVAASPDYLARRGRPRTPQALERHDLLGFASWGPDPVLRFERAGASVPVPVRGALTINNGQALLAAALAGAGVIVQADALLDAPLAAGTLVRLLPQWRLPERPLHLVRLPEARPSAKLRTFVDLALARLGPA
jgi:DNA-binding transcriptional LysR family regulator